MHEPVDVPGEHARHVRGLQPAADVLHHLVRIQDVVADLAPEADVALLALEDVDLGVTLRLADLVQARAQDLHRGLFVLELRLLVLAGHHEAGRKVRDADRGVRRVDRLSARPRGTVDVDPDLVVLDLDVDVVGEQRQHLDAGERGLAALLLVGRADAHEAVHAGLRRQHPVRVPAVHREDGAVDADLDALRDVVEVDLPLPGLRVLGVHAQQHLGPVLGLEAALARCDGDERVAVVELAGEQRGELEVADALVDLGQRRGDLGGELRIVLRQRELVACFGVVERGAQRGHRLDLVADLGGLRHRGLRGRGVVPEAGLGRFRLESVGVDALRVEMQVLADAREAPGCCRYVCTAIFDHGSCQCSRCMPRAASPQEGRPHAGGHAIGVRRSRRGTSCTSCRSRTGTGRCGPRSPTGRPCP